MDEVSIKAHFFQDAIDKIKNFSVQELQTIEKVETSGGLFDWFNHTVTGEELNERLEIIQSYFIKINTYIIKLKDEFGDVYQSFEYLDKEYIKAILISLEEAKEASKQAKKAQDDTNHIVEILQLTVDRLESTIKEYEFLQEWLRKYKELESIDQLFAIGKNNEKRIEDLYLVYGGIQSDFLRLNEKIGELFDEQNTNRQKIENLYLLSEKNQTALSQSEEEINELSTIAKNNKEQIGNLYLLAEEIKTDLSNHRKGIDDLYLLSGGTQSDLFKFKEEMMNSEARNLMNEKKNSKKMKILALILIFNFGITVTFIILYILGKV